MVTVSAPTSDGADAVAAGTAGADGLEMSTAVSWPPKYEVTYARLPDIATDVAPERFPVALRFEPATNGPVPADADAGAARINAMKPANSQRLALDS
jgi:hypothetical protein